MVTARTLVRSLVRVAALAMAVVGARQALGPVVSSVVLTAAGLGFGVRAWGRWENRWGTPRPTRVLMPDVVYRRACPTSSERHVVFARALAAIAAAYAAECEQEVTQP